MIWERKQSTVSKDIIHMSEDRKEWWNSSTCKTIGRLEIIGKESCFKHLEIVNNFPGGSDICLKCGKPRFDPWIGKISWRRRWQPTPVLLPGKFHEWRSLVGYSPWGRKESDTTMQLHFTFTLGFPTYSKSPTNELSGCRLSKMWTHIPSTSGMSETTVCPCLPLLTVFELHRLRPPLPPPGSNSSCLFTPCQPLCVSCLTVHCTFQGTVL